MTTETAGGGCWCSATRCARTPKTRQLGCCKPTWTKLVVDKARMENYFNRKGKVPAKGPIQLQTHGGEISWRNVFIREIPK